MRLDELAGLAVNRPPLLAASFIGGRHDDFGGCLHVEHFEEQVVGDVASITSRPRDPPGIVDKVLVGPLALDFRIHRWRPSLEAATAQTQDEYDDAACYPCNRLCGPAEHPRTALDGATTKCSNEAFRRTLGIAELRGGVEES